MRSVARFACGLVALMAVTGCSGGLTPTELPGQVPATSAGAGPSTPAETGPPRAAADGPGLSAAQLEAVLAAVNEAERLNAQVIPQAELQAARDEARSAEGIVVTPEECNLHAESGPGSVPDDAGLAAMTFAGASSLQPDSVSLWSLPSEAAANGEVEATRDQLDECTEYTMVISGQEIMTTVAEVAVETAADEDLAMRTTAQVPGTIQESLTVRAVVGSTVLDVQIGTSADPDADIARAERLADLVVAELRLL